MKKFSKFIAITVTVLTASQSSIASAKEMDYPELAMAPRYSQRLFDEAKNEANSSWSDNYQLILGGLFTALAGVTHEPVALTSTQIANGEKQKDFAFLGYAVGGVWILAGFLMPNLYQPYRSGAKSISQMPKGTMRQRLVRERRAERIINDAGSAGRRIAWISAITNAGTNFLLLDANDSGQSSLGSIFSAAGIAVAFLPLIFKSHWQEVANEQEGYRKRIYGPISSAGPTLLRDAKSGKYSPGIQVSLAF